MDYLKQIKFNITKCDLSDIVNESSRFIFHITLVHIITYIIDGKEELMGLQLMKTLVVTAIAITLYHIILKKIAEPKLRKIRYKCKIYNETTNIT
jgi:dolichol kinase